MAEGGNRVVGFECEFVEDPPSWLQTECPVCLQILREPYQVTCCGKSFCRECIERVKAGNKPCPCCKQDSYNDFPNKGLQQPLYGFRVHCSNKGEGCDWIGELGQLDNHLNLNQSSKVDELEGCEFARIKCTYCSDIVKRNSLQHHKNDLCDKRPFSCEHCNDYESTYDDVIHNHWPVCGYHPVKCPNQCEAFQKRHELESHVARDCPLTVVECDFSYTGCEVRLPRKDMPGHLKDSLVAHLSLLTVKYKRQQEDFISQIKRQQEEMETLKSKSEQQQDEIETLKAQSKRQQDEIEALKEEVGQLRGHEGTFPIDFVVKNVHQYNSGRPWSSNHFYSHAGGYKLKITFYDNPYCGYLFRSYLMQGEFDNQSKWPMKADIFMLIQHKHEEDLKFTISAKCDKPITGGRTHQCGCWSSASHTSRDVKKYLHDDCLRLRITGIHIS